MAKMFKNFALEQGFDEFHDASEMPSNEENAWGVADGDMFKAINAYMDKHRGEKIIKCHHDDVKSSSI